MTTVSYIEIQDGRQGDVQVPRHSIEADSYFSWSQDIEVILRGKGLRKYAEKLLESRSRRLPLQQTRTSRAGKRTELIGGSYGGSGPKAGYRHRVFTDGNWGELQGNGLQDTVPLRGVSEG